MANDLVYGFLDESPSLQSGAYFFCVSLLVGSNPSDKHLHNIIKKARQKLSSKEKQISELKFANTLPDVRKLILNSIADQLVDIFVFVVETNKQCIVDSPENYGLIAGNAISLVTKKHKKLSVILDRKYIRPVDVGKMEKVINETVLINNHPNFLSLREEDSKNNPLLQLADFVVGAFNAKYNRNDPVYWQIISKKIKGEKVVKWKELKRNS